MFKLASFGIESTWLTWADCAPLHSLTGPLCMAHDTDRDGIQLCSPPPPVDVKPAMHRALYILDILDIIFAHCETTSLAALARTTSIFFEPAARHLWERMTSPRTLLDAMGGTMISKADDIRRFERFATYTKSVTALQLFLGSTYAQTCNPYHIYSLVSDFSFPSLRSLTASMEHTIDFPLALRFIDSSKGQCKTLRLGFDKCTPDDVGPNGERFWDEMRDVCSGVTVLELYLNTETRWPSSSSLDGLAPLTSLQKLHIRSRALRVEHFSVLARLPELTTLSLIFPVLDDPPSADVVLPPPRLIPSDDQPTFPALTSLEIHGSSFPPALALLSLLPLQSALVDLRIWHLWTTPSIHSQFITLLQQHAPHLQSVILSLFSPVLGSAVPAEYYPLIPFTTLTQLHTLDLTLTSSTPVFSPSLSPAFLDAVGTSLPHLEHLRLVTFDYSYHFLSPTHEPLVTLPSLLPLAIGCPNLHTLQLEFSIPESLPAILLPDPPPANPSLQRLLIAWSRLPDPRSVHFAIAARWLALLFPSAALGWGRWSHTENDVPDGLWGGHDAFGDLPSSTFNTADMPAGDNVGAGAGGGQIVAAGGQVMEAPVQRGRDGGFAGIDIARERARVFSDMVRAWQAGALMDDDSDMDVDVPGMDGVAKSNVIVM